MTTVYKSAQITSGKPPRVLPAGYSCTVINTFLNATAFILNDTVQMVQIEADPSIVGSNGPTMNDLSVDMPAMDSSTGFTWIVGDSNTTNKYISTSTVGQSSAGGVVRLNQQGAVGYQPFKTDFGSFGTYTAVSLVLYTIVIKITAAATGTPTTGNTITMSVDYTYDP